MTREQLEHLIRAAGAITGDDRLLVIGSQAILGSFLEKSLPDVVTVSYEADIAFFDDTDGAKSDLLDGSIGELSLFQQTFGIYAQGVSLNTAVLPEGWRDRLIPLASVNTGGVIGYCLEPHDLCIAKLAAGRSHDVTFCRALMDAGIVERDTLAARLASTDLAPAKKEQIARIIDR